MIEDKDFVMRIISRLGAFLRLILKGEGDRLVEMEVDDTLAELVGLPTTMLLSMSSDSIVGLMQKIPSADSVALSGILLTLKARLAKNHVWEEAGRKIIGSLAANALSPEVRNWIEQLPKEEPQRQ